MVPPGNSMGCTTYESVEKAIRSPDGRGQHRTVPELFEASDCGRSRGTRRRRARPRTPARAVGEGDDLLDQTWPPTADRVDAQPLPVLGAVGDLGSGAVNGHVPPPGRPADPAAAHSARCAARGMRTADPHLPSRRHNAARTMPRGDERGPDAARGSGRLRQWAVLPSGHRDASAGSFPVDDRTGDGRLSQREPAVVGGHDTMSQDLQAGRHQAGSYAARQQSVRERASGQSDRPHVAAPPRPPRRARPIVRQGRMQSMRDRGPTTPASTGASTTARVRAVSNCRCPSVAVTTEGRADGPWWPGGRGTRFDGGLRLEGDDRAHRKRRHPIPQAADAGRHRLSAPVDWLATRSSRRDRRQGTGRVR